MMNERLGEGVVVTPAHATTGRRLADLASGLQVEEWLADDAVSHEVESSRRNTFVVHRSGYWCHGLERVVGDGDAFIEHLFAPSIDER